MEQFVCIQCGAPAAELSRQFVGGTIKIANCDRCGQVVDKYIEYDPVLVVLDAILHKPAAYRHILVNSVFHAHRKLALLLILCDTYLRWQALQAPHGLESHSNNEHIFYAALEIDFYKMFLFTVIDWFLLGLILTTSVCILRRFNKNNTTRTSSGDVLKSWVVSNFGKLLAIPAILWGQSSSAIYLALSALFVFTSNVQAIKVICELDRFVSLLIVGISWTVQHLISYLIHTQVLGG